MADQTNSKSFEHRLEGADLQKAIEEVLGPLMGGGAETVIVYAALKDGSAVLRVVGSPVDILALYNQMDPKFFAMMVKAQRDQHFNG